MLFRHRRESKKKTEIAVLITPHIVREAPAEMARTPPPPLRPAGKLWDADFVMALSKAL
jgi:Flp pilus assembly secretin CpaC